MKKRLLRIEEGVPSKQARLSFFSSLLLTTNETVPRYTPTTPPLLVPIRQHPLLQRDLRRLSVRLEEGNRTVFTNQTYTLQIPQRPYCERIVHAYRH